MVTIRGAITVEQNTEKDILDGITLLLEQVISANDLDDKHIISILFSATKDLDAVYPAVAARKLGITQASLLCFQEMHVVGSLEKCLRVMVHVEKEAMTQDSVQHIYMRGAERLRPDLMMEDLENE